MRPRGVPSKWVKVLPWYYTERNQPSRSVELHSALEREAVADGGTRIFPDLPCAQAGCDARASRVAVQTGELDLIFGSMAGAVCDDHTHGLPSLSFSGFGKAAKEEL